MERHNLLIGDERHNFPIGDEKRNLGLETGLKGSVYLSTASFPAAFTDVSNEKECKYYFYGL
jgi:hypothetical protein